MNESESNYPSPAQRQVQGGAPKTKFLSVMTDCCSLLVLFLTGMPALTSAVTVAGFDPAKTYLICEGDSLTAGSTDYPYLILETYGSNFFAWFTNAAVGGQGIVYMTNVWLSQIAPHSPGTGTNAIFSIWVGANDYTDTLLAGTIGVTNYCNRLSDYWGQARSSNMVVVAFTILIRATNWDGESSGSLSNRDYINSFIRTNGIPNYVIDAAAMFPDNHNLADFNSDFTHLNADAQVRLMKEWARQLVQFSAPQLTIIRSAANIILTWPANAAGFTLQFTTNLVSPAVWSTVSPGPTVVNGQNAVTNSVSGTNKFYRLLN